MTVVQRDRSGKGIVRVGRHRKWIRSEAAVCGDMRTSNVGPLPSADTAANHAREGFSSNRTVFGKILRGELPASVAYEDSEVLCFRDIAPASEHHYLVIPKRQIAHAGALQSAGANHTP